MRILAVTPYYPPEGGGLERYARSTLDRLAAHGHDVRVMATTRDGSRPARTAVDLQPAQGVAVERRTVPLHLGNAPIDLRLVQRIRNGIRDFRPDVVVGHAPVPFPAEAAARAAQREGVPFVLTYHAGRLRGSSLPLEALARVARASTQRRLFASSDRLIAVSRFVRDNALAGHGDRTTIIPPGVDAQRFRPAAGVDEQEILFVGPLSRNYRWKGVDVLWKAFTSLREQGVAARLRLVGSGDRSSDFRARAAARDDVQVDGHLRDDDLLAAYQRAGVVVLPSTGDAEAFGMVLAEANACGRPVVGSDLGGIPDFVEHGRNGLLVRPGDPHDLGAKLRSLLANPQEMDRLGATGRQKVLQDHDWDDLSRRTEQVLATVVGRQGRIETPAAH